MHTTHHVTVTHDGPWWLIAVPGLGEVTQARLASDVEATARELIAVTTGADDPQSIAIHVTWS